MYKISIKIFVLLKATLVYGIFNFDFQEEVMTVGKEAAE